LGTATIPNSTPQAVSITPSSGTFNVNTAYTFATVVSDTNTYLNIAQCQFMINTQTADGLRCFYGNYDRITNKLYLMSDTGSWIGGYAPGSSYTIQNSYATLNCQSSSVSYSGNNLTVNWKLIFKSPFTGNKNSYLYVQDLANANSGWKQVGTATIPNNMPQAVSISPSSGTFNINTAYTFTTVSSDPDTYLNIYNTQFMVNTQTADGLRCFYGNYDRITNKLYLMSDTGTWIGGFVPGSANTIQNSYSTLNCQNSSASYSGNNLTINWNLTFKTQFTGSKNSYLSVLDNTFSGSGWKQLGTATITASTDTTPPTGSITINSNAQYTNKTQVTLTLSATDNSSGMDKMQFSNNNSTWSTAETYATTRTWTLTSGDGTKTVYVKFSDKAGNWSQAYSDTIILDTTPPITVITSPVGGYTTDNPGLLIEGTINDTAINKVLIIARLHDGTGYNIVYQWWEYPASNGKFSIDLRTNNYLRHGKSRIEASVTDAAGNNYWTTNENIIYDKGPVITSSSPANNTTFTELDTIPVSITATDADNDTLKYQFSIDGTIKQSWGISTSYNWQTQTGNNGEHTILIQINDGYVTITRQIKVYVWRKPINVPN
jgi:hypothetical protein